MLTAAPLSGFVGLDLPSFSELLSVKADAAYSGTCGDNLTWTLDDEGTLTISGEGAMTDWSYYYSVPWYSYRSSVKTVTIGNAVTNIGDYAFEYCAGLESITIPDSITSIGKYAFNDCTSLKSVTIGDSVTSIGYCAFSYCSSLESVTIHDSIISIGYYAFCCCTSLESITADGNNEYYSSDEYGVLFNKDKTKLISTL